MMIIVITVMTIVMIIIGIKSNKLATGDHVGWLRRNDDNDDKDDDDDDGDYDN